MISKEVVRKFVKLNLNPVPVELNTKRPLRKLHTEPITDSEIDTLVFPEIGISTGYSSLNLEVLDFDLKNTDNPEDFIYRFNKMIPTDLYSSLVIQSTPSGGLHYLYRSNTIEANQKLARNKYGAAIIETRGIGGYIKCAPSKGYKLVSNKTFSNIPYLTKEQRDYLITVSKQFDLLNTKDLKKRYSKEDLEGFNKFLDYNSDSNIGIKLLEDAGWKYHSTNGDWYNLTRPNSNSFDLHGGYNTKEFFFQTFSTAQDVFEERRGYNNHHLFAELKCDGNYKKAYSILYDEGWGKVLNENDSDITPTFITDYKDENEYLEQARKNQVPLGRSFGWICLDDYIRWKENSFYFILGLDNIGKSTILSSFIVASNILHNFKWGISSPEASTDVTRRNLIESHLGKDIKDFTQKEKDNLLEFSRKNFYIINNDKHLSIDEVLDRGKVLYEKYGIDFLLIDPFSFYAGSGNFNSDTDVLSKIRVFCQNYCSVVVVDHPYTGFTRDSLNKDGFLNMPTKYDSSGGNIKPNRCDDFISIHRVINHPDKDVRHTLQISVQKVKDKSSGGQPHIQGSYTPLIYETRNGFKGFWDEMGNNPMYKDISSKLNLNNKINEKIIPDDIFY